MAAAAIVLVLLGTAIVLRSSDEADAAAPTQTAGPDSVRLLRTMSVLAHDSMAGRGTGTIQNAHARSFLLAELQGLGAESGSSGYEQPFTWGSGAGTNVVGRIPGTERASTIVLTAHFDHVGVRDGEIYNGADDNASGTAAVLEIARLVAEAPLQSSLVVALLDAEEVGLRGARAFVEEPPVELSGEVLNVNLDMVSRSGGVLWASGAHHTPALRPVLERVAAVAPVTLRLGHDRPDAPEGSDWTNSSDHGPFHSAGFPFVYFGVENHPDYHRPTDDVERVNPEEFVHSVRTILMAIRALDQALPFPSTGAPR